MKTFPLRLNKQLPRMEELMEKLEANPTPDISAESMRHADAVARVAQVLTNLKETAKKQLNHAALYIKTAITTLAIALRNWSQALILPGKLSR